MPAASRSPRGLRLWCLAVRPRTLSLAAVPVLCGGALAWHGGAPLAGLTFIVTLACAVLIQAGTNLYNDAADAQGGSDGPARLGPLRVTAAGLATPREVRRAAGLCFALALAGGIYLVAVGGWSILVVGLMSLAAGWAYSGGPRPLSHSRWGEVWVLAFFGLVAVAGSQYLQGSRPALPALLVGAAVGAQAAAVLLVNNLRDWEADRLAGRHTLAATLGETRARHLYAALVLAPLPLLVTLGWVLGDPLRLWPLVSALPACAWLAWRFQGLPIGPQMNVQLARTAQAQLLVGALLSLALLA
jgi:1,4-dihydroxy-2-naphthoate polyprenyltransferase